MANAMESRVSNLLAVLQAIHKQPGISKLQICRQCGLATSTVQNIVTRLLELGVICSQSDALSTGGRKAAIYRIEATHRYIVSVCVRSDKAAIGIVDLECRLHSRQELQQRLESLGPEAYVDLLAGNIRAAMEQSGIPPQQFAGIGINIPGAVDDRTGVIMELPGAPHWRNFPLADRVKEALGLHTMVDKNTYLGLRYLEYSGQIPSGSNCLYITIEDMIGAAYVLDGAVYRGAHALAGEVGHITVRRDGARCHCGNTGCFELYCSNVGILSQYNAQTGHSCQSIDALSTIADSGDAFARRVFAQALHYVIDVLASLIMSFDPDQIIIDCRWLNLQKPLYHSLLDSLHNKSSFTSRQMARITLLAHEDLTLHGAAAVIASYYLFSKNSPVINSFL